MLNTIIPDWLIDKLKEEQRRKEQENDNRLYIEPPPPPEQDKPEIEYDSNVDYSL